MSLLRLVSNFRAEVQSPGITELWQRHTRFDLNVFVMILTVLFRIKIKQ